MADALLLMKQWLVVPPAFISLSRISQMLGAALGVKETIPPDAMSATATPKQYSSKEDILAFQSRVNGVQGVGK